jgi:hypothetical protein
MPEYKATFKKIADLTEQNRRDLAMLYLSYYDGSSEELMLSDLDRKTEVLLVYCGDAVIGFTTMQVYDRVWNAETIRIIYSGDTVVDRAHWGQQALAFAWIARMGEIKRERPEVSMYWFVIMKGHRTYKFLPTFGKSFYPHWSIDRSDLKPLADSWPAKSLAMTTIRIRALLNSPNPGDISRTISLCRPRKRWARNPLGISYIKTQITCAATARVPV